MMLYLRLFFEFFKTGLFSIGGGMATIPFLYKMSDATGWFSHNDLANMIAVGESTPGPIGVNMATYVGFVTGMQQGGLPFAILGGVVATFGLFTDGCDKFDKAFEAGIFDKIFTTNLVYRRPELSTRKWYVEVNMCKYVAYIIDTLNHDETLSELLNPVKRINKLVEQHKKDQETQVQIKFEN